MKNVKCDVCNKVLKEEPRQAQLWNASITSGTLGTEWIEGPVIDICGNCYDKLMRSDTS